MPHNKTRANKDLVGQGTKISQSISYDIGFEQSKEARLEEKDRTKQIKVLLSQCSTWSAGRCSSQETSSKPMVK